MFIVKQKHFHFCLTCWTAWLILSDIKITGQLTGGDLTTLDPVIKSPVGTLDMDQPLADLLHAAAHEATANFGRVPVAAN